jgi:hypothetical protein
MVGGSGRFVAIGFINGLVKAAYSTDGDSWTEVIVYTNETIGFTYTKVIYGDGKFIFAKDSNIWVSTDGAAWNATAVDDTFTTYVPITYGNGTFVIFGTGGSKWYSTNGSVWTKVTDASGSFSGVAYGNDRFVAVGYGRAAYSDNGINWTDTTFTSNSWTSVAAWKD